jgi:hypothetical protein
MANAQRPELSSAFDDMLSKNKKSFEELYRGGRSLAGPTGAITKPAAGWEKPAAASPRAAVPVQLGPNSQAARLLNERLGNEWRYEVAEQKRDGDEAIVLCKLIFGKDGAVRTQFGRSKITDASVAGARAGVRYKMGDTSAAADESEAFRRATEAALMHCVELI